MTGKDFDDVTDAEAELVIAKLDELIGQRYELSASHRLRRLLV